MLKTIKKYLFPHRGNGYRPYLLKETGILVVLLIILVSFAFSAGGSYVVRKTKLTSLVLSGVLVDYANKDRDSLSYSHLVINPVLVKAAQLKANDMAEKGYFAHTSPEGKTPWYWFKQSGYDFAYAGENLAVNFSESEEVNNAWMNSPGHKANIMNDKFTEIGVATAQGLYQGKPTVFVVQLFGRPRVIPTNQKVPNQVAPTVKTVVSKDIEPKVLSESVSVDENNPRNTEMFVAVKGVESASPTPAKRKFAYSNFIERWLSSPVKYLGWFYIFISLVIIISLFSFFFIEIKREHNKMIILSVLLILVMFSLIYYFRFVLLESVLII